MMAFKLAGTTYNGFRTFLDVDTKLLHPDIRHHFSGGFYVHVESLPFLGSNTEDTKASQILRSYQGSPADKQVVVLTWQELIELGIATQTQVRKILNLSASERIMNRKQLR